MRFDRLLPTLLLVMGQNPPSFEPIQPELFGAGSNLVNAAADYDRDGDPDLFIGMNGTPNRLYRNDQGTFTEVGTAAGVADARGTRAAAFGDFDNDGDPDLLIGFTPGIGSVLRLYRNDAGIFVDATEAAGLKTDSGAVRQLAWIDIDRDGDLDLFVAFRDRPNALFRNDRGRFTDVAPTLGIADPRRSVGAVWFDYDEDGDLDLYLANMDGDANALYRNDGDRFAEVASAGLEWGGRAPADPTNGSVRPCAADVNGDGHLDLIIANYGPAGLFLNQGNGGFEDRSNQWGLALDSRYDTCAPADFDNDGRVDLYLNGTVTGGVSFRDHLFRNTGDRFVDVTPAAIEALQADHGALWLDFDGNGALDLALTGSRRDGMHYLLRNRLGPEAAARSIAVRVIGPGPAAAAPGTEVRLYRAGSRTLLGTGLLDTGSGYNAQSVGPLHFGLPPGVTTVDIEVTEVSPGRPITALRQVRPANLPNRTAIVTLRRR